jgi:hypothetical protein
MYLIHCKNFCKCYPAQQLKEKKTRKKEKKIVLGFAQYKT